MHLSTAALLALFALPLAACQYEESSQIFDVSATLTSTTCGTGALDADDSLSFQVSLQRDDDTLTWYDIDLGTEMQAPIVDDEVTISSSQDFEVTESTDDAVGCSVRRRDVYDATLVGSGTTIEQVEGDVTFTFSEVSGYDCEPLVGASDGFDDLPCKMIYDFVAVPAD